MTFGILITLIILEFIVAFVAIFVIVKSIKAIRKIKSEAENSFKDVPDNIHSVKNYFKGINNKIANKPEAKPFDEDEFSGFLEGILIDLFKTILPGFKIAKRFIVFSVIHKIVKNSGRIKATFEQNFAK